MAACASSNTKGETVTDLVRAVRDEEVKVHINVEEGVRVSFRVLALRGMCNVCVYSQKQNFAKWPSIQFPSTEASDELASAYAKAMCCCD